ncbi:hypothetical protein SAMN02910400_01536 [Lachnospiraceae bacterium C10]|jgi:hypothetical protein|nr:hypothetical protein SAMN02910400_01536 [Lachnospiraceae bacterium C10]
MPEESNINFGKNQQKMMVSADMGVVYKNSHYILCHPRPTTILHLTPHFANRLTTGFLPCKATLLCVK